MPTHKLPLAIHPHALHRFLVGTGAGQRRRKGTLSNTGQMIHFDLPRSGDLVNQAFAVFHLPGLANIVDCKTGVSIHAINYLPYTGDKGSMFKVHSVLTLSYYSYAFNNFSDYNAEDFNVVPRVKSIKDGYGGYANVSIFQRSLTKIIKKTQ